MLTSPRCSGALDVDARLVVVIDGEPSRQLARQLAAARSGTTRVVEPSELAATLERWPTDGVLGAQCLSVPGGATSLASGAHLPRPGVLNPGSGDWEQILADGSDRRAPDWWSWSLVARAGAGDDLAGQASVPGDTLPGPVTLRAIDGSPSGGGSGLIAHLGTRGPDGLSEVSRFRNPAATGMLCLSASSVLIGGVDGISDRSGSDGDRGDGGGIGILHTDDDADAAVTLKLGPDRSLRLETVALRQRGDDAAALLRDFAVDIRLGGDWVTVGEGRHEGGPAGWHRLDLEALPPTDAVRIRRTGPNSMGTGHLVIDDVELYGVLATTQR
jgi:hypothetical protein